MKVMKITKILMFLMCFMVRAFLGLRELFQQRARGRIDRRRIALEPLVQLERMREIDALEIGPVKGCQGPTVPRSKGSCQVGAQFSRRAAHG